MGLPFTDAQIEQLTAYGTLLAKWNKTINLISRRDIGRLGSRHFLDSLAALPLLRGKQIMDLGSGAGLPGIPLALAVPQLSFTLCDRSERRVRFLQHVVRELAIDNVEVWLGDLDKKSTPSRMFDTVLARGVATATVVWDMVHLLLAEKACVLVYESTQAAVEGPEIPNNLKFQISRHNYDVPGLGHGHSILCMESV